MQSGDMRYEPGNWGDVLKGLWVEALVRHRLRSQPGPVAVCDGFAGHPTYPLTAGTRTRLRELGESHRYVQLQGAWVAQGLLGSAATLARESLEREPREGNRIMVYDTDPAKVEHYTRVGGFEIASIEDGFAILEDPYPTQFQLLVLDPYEFIWRYEEMLPRVLAAADRTDLVIYLYDKAPGSGAYHRNYTNFLHDLDEARPGGSYLLGRVPVDGFLPRIYHEMLYLPGPHGWDRGALSVELRRDTQALARHILDHHEHLRGEL